MRRKARTKQTKQREILLLLLLLIIIIIIISEKKYFNTNKWSQHITSFF